MRHLESRISFLESPDDIVVVIITLYLCFGPCTEVHQNGYWKRCTAFYFYVLLANDYSAALFYALCAILCLGNFLHVQALTPKGVSLSQWDSRRACS